MGTDGSNKIADDIRVSAADGKVVDLAADQHASSFVRTIVKTSFVHGRFKTMPGDDAIDEFLPKSARFRVALERMLNGKDHVPGDDHAMSIRVPVGILIINVHKGRLIRWGGNSRKRWWRPP